MKITRWLNSVTPASMLVSFALVVALATPHSVFAERHRSPGDTPPGGDTIPGMVKQNRLNHDDTGNSKNHMQRKDNVRQPNRPMKDNSATSTNPTDEWVVLHSRIVGAPIYTTGTVRSSTSSGDDQARMKQTKRKFQREEDLVKHQNRTANRRTSSGRSWARWIR